MPDRSCTLPLANDMAFVMLLAYRVAQIHRVRYIIGHSLQVSLQLWVKLAGNDLYHNKSYESSPPCMDM